MSSRSSVDDHGHIPPATEGPTASLAHRDERAGLVVRVLSESLLTTRPLPTTGELLIGRSADAALRLDDDSVSRKHAVLFIGPTLRLQDLGGTNGTLVGTRRLAPGETVVVALNETITIGKVLLVVQAAPATAEEKGGPLDLDMLIERLAKSSISVLLLGETGVGKEVVATRIHRASPRAPRPFVPIHCGALPEPLLESELFGFARGAFTGAVAAKPGLLDTAEGGTVFLDEVGELSLATQVKLLRVLETRQLQPLGATTPHAVDVRFIAATHRDLEQAIVAGSFRQDLYFRLNGIALTIPPLRQRPGEIEQLAREFLAEAARREGRVVPTLSAAGAEHLRQRPWPGNVRELKNAMERALVLASGDVIDVAHLPGPTLRPGDARTDQRQRIVDALAACGGNQSLAAKRLGMSRNTLAARLRTFAIPRPRR
jgi:two-component system response regulator AtoC